MVTQNYSKQEKKAEKWIDRHSYSGMSFHYEIREVEDNYNEI